MDINFCANLKINPNIFKKIPPNAPTDYPASYIKKWVQFFDTPLIKKMTDGDTIEIKHVPYAKRGYGVEFNFICGNDPSKSVQGGYFNSKNSLSFSPISLPRQTFQFLCNKFDVKRGFFEKEVDCYRRLIEKFKSM